MVRRQLLDLHADDFGETGGELLRYGSMLRREVETDKCGFKRPVSSFGSAANNHPAQGGK